jgi:hypothetical protein
MRHPSEVFQQWESQVRRVLSNPGGAHAFPMHIVHYVGRDESGKFRAFDVMTHKKKPDHITFGGTQVGDYTITFGETRVDGTEPENAMSKQDAGMYIHFHMKGDKENSTLEQAVADFVVQEKLTGLTQIAETFTVGELQFQMIDVVRQLIKETAN